MRKQIKTFTELRKSYEKLWSKRDFIENTKYYQWIVKLLNAKKGERVLDVGCGAGYFLEQAQKEGIICYGIDIAKNAVEIARNNVKKCRIQQGIAEHLPYKDEFFNYVVCLGSLEHFLQPKKAVLEMKRVLKNDGFICIVVPNKWAINDILRGIIYGINQNHGQELERFFTYNEIIEMISRVGLDTVRVYGYNQPQQVKIRTGTVLSFFCDLLYAVGYRLLHHYIPVRISYSFVLLLKKSDRIGK